MPYGVAARDYLARAKARLMERTQEGLFYAAFEFRCCVETRQEDYARAIEFEKFKVEAWRIGLRLTATEVIRQREDFPYLHRPQGRGAIRRLLYTGHQSPFQDGGKG